MQTIDQLNASFAIPGILFFEEHGDLVRARVTTPACTGELYLQGAHVTAWQPADQQPVLFLSEKSAFVPGKPFAAASPSSSRGSAHARQRPKARAQMVPSHGFARTQTWKLDFGAYAADELHLSLSLEPTELSRSLGFDNFLVAYQITFGRELRLRLSVANNGNKPLHFEEALHTYLHVGDVERASVHGLFEAEYLDKNDHFARKTQTEPVLTLTGPTDRPYLNTTSPIVVDDPTLHRRITVTKGNSNTTVVWNPWANAGLADMPEDGWRHMLVHRIRQRRRERHHPPATGGACARNIFLRRGAALMRLILASSSPRRRELLAQIALTFEVLPAHIDETRRASEEPTAYVQRLALEKAQTIHALHPGAFVLGADTTVEIDGHALEKPADRADAERMLRALSGRTHHVHTGLALLSPHGHRTHLETTSVTFSAIDEAELQHYLDGGEPYDKAGAYGIQGYAARWIPRIDGDYFNVMGLPLAATVRLLKELGYSPD